MSLCTNWSTSLIYFLGEVCHCPQQLICLNLFLCPLIILLERKFQALYSPFLLLLYCHRIKLYWVREGDYNFIGVASFGKFLMNLQVGKAKEYFNVNLGGTPVVECTDCIRSQSYTHTHTYVNVTRLSDRGKNAIIFVPNFLLPRNE
jgi:hypothetical protein